MASNPFQQTKPIVDAEGRPTPYFIQQMLLLTGETGVTPGFYNITGFTVDSSGRVTSAIDPGGVYLMERQVLTTATASTTFPVNGNSNDLILSIHGRSDTAATTDVIRLRFNGDTGNNYYSDRVNRSANVQVAAGAYAEAGVIPAASTTAGRAGAVELTIPDYNNTNFMKEFSYTNYYNSGATPLASYGGGHWENTSVITSVTLYLAAGNWDVGTTISLYGRG